MSSIRSVLIRTCMANVQKEISQLEHWLNNLSDDGTPRIPSQCPAPGHSYDEHFEFSNLNRVIERLAEDVSNQRHTLNNILERLDNLEGFRRPNREVFIDENVEQNGCNRNDPWLDNNCEPLENELIGEEDDISEPLYTRNNKSLSAESSVGTPSIIPDIPEDKSLPPDIDSDQEEEEETEEQDKVTFPPKTTEKHTSEPSKLVEVKPEDKKPAVVQEAEEEEEVEVEEEEEEEDVEEATEEAEEEEEEEEEEVEKVEKEVEKVEKEVEEEEEEEEEEGQELEEIEYNAVRYYKDNENFIYSVDEDDQPSENPVGYWKEKSQTIAFYKTK